MQIEIDTQPSTNYNDVAIRPLHCRLNAQTRSDGSSMLTQGKNRIVYFNLEFFEFCSNSILFSGDTAVTATVFGPIEVKLHNLQIDKAHVEVHYRSKSGLPTIGDRLREQIIRETCESALLTVLYPRSSIFIQVHEMENAGGVRIFNYFHINEIYFPPDSLGNSKTLTIPIFSYS